MTNVNVIVPQDPTFIDLDADLNTSLFIEKYIPHHSIGLAAMI